MTAQAITVLDKYLSGGYLNLAGSIFSAKERYKAGSRLALEYYLGYSGALKSHNCIGVNNCKTNLNMSAFTFNERAVYYRTLFTAAKKSVPIEFWLPVFEVCIKDNMLVGRYNADQKLLNKHDVYCQKILLCMGLDRLIRHYLRSDSNV